MDPRDRLGRWLALWAAMLYLLILIGGATRLTESGLSITEWHPVSGVIPPLSAADWNAEFAKYQQIPQYRALNPDMTVSQFKGIFLWEYTHRLWARLVGVAFLVPLLVFLARGQVPRAYRRRLWLLLLLLGAQGALGWFMVASGLSGRTEVSQYRLAAHLAAALLIYGATVWIAADFLRGSPEVLPGSRVMRKGAIFATGLAVTTAVAGAFVAGLRAGRAFNTFPLMAGRIVPPGFGALTPWWRNAFENVATVQFDHRLLALTTLLVILLLWWRGRGASIPVAARSALGWFAVAAVVQVGLGIATLLLVVPIPLGVAHQAGAVAVVTCGLLAVHALTPGPVATPDGAA